MRRASPVFAIGLVASGAAAMPPVVERDEGAFEPHSSAPLVIATDGQPPPEPRPWRPPEPSPWHDGVACGAGFGAAFVAGVERGLYARLDCGAYDIQHRRRGVIFGMLLGLEGWRASGEAWGLGLPAIVYGGIQSDALFTTLGTGFDLALLDRVEAQTGVGFFAPEADLKLGVDLEGVRFLANARAGYRWQLGADDRASLRVGGEIHLTTD